MSRDARGSKQAAGYHVAPIGDRLPRQGNRLTRAIGRTLLRWTGWRFEGAVPNRDKLLAIGAPHTTAWDFALAMMAILALGVRVSWLGADWVFRFPFMRAIGGIPVDRSVRQGMVPQAIRRFAERPKLILALTPEGSRKKVVPWKTGFYHIAAGAGVPVLMVSIDLENKLLRFGPSFEPSGDYEADMETKIEPFYADLVDRFPERFGIR